MLDQPFKREFTVGPLPENMARQYLCSHTNAPAAGLEWVVFMFRTDDGGTLGLLWVPFNQ